MGHCGWSVCKKKQVDQLASGTLCGAFHTSLVVSSPVRGHAGWDGKPLFSGSYLEFLLTSLNDGLQPGSVRWKSVSSPVAFSQCLLTATAWTRPDEPWPCTDRPFIIARSCGRKAVPPVQDSNKVWDLGADALGAPELLLGQGRPLFLFLGYLIFYFNSIAYKYAHLFKSYDTYKGKTRKHTAKERY